MSTEPSPTTERDDEGRDEGMRRTRFSACFPRSSRSVRRVTRFTSLPPYLRYGIFYPYSQLISQLYLLVYIGISYILGIFTLYPYHMTYSSYLRYFTSRTYYHYLDPYIKVHYISQISILGYIIISQFYIFISYIQSLSQYYISLLSSFIGLVYLILGLHYKDLHYISQL